MEEDQAYSEPVVKDSLHPMISRLLRHAQGQTLTEFYSPMPQGLKVMGQKLLYNARYLQVLHMVFTSYATNLGAMFSDVQP